ncbi:hypothetical protein COV13_00755 [Candidatus Woesearchaeota archaeon CG10_big_fil_rev_8_21_14_0_10_32_9]|nr:MAG: hypothetical protein COV13_00755 [Candidatus Woesearchaeota archaeon CG10_big_fil_rev_8_21_14_0_10_32_9]
MGDVKAQIKIIVNKIYFLSELQIVSDAKPVEEFIESMTESLSNLDKSCSQILLTEEADKFLKHKAGLHAYLDALTRQKNNKQHLKEINDAAKLLHSVVDKISTK